jgi:hypothetical protein
MITERSEGQVFWVVKRFLVAFQKVAKDLSYYN